MQLIFNVFLSVLYLTQKSKCQILLQHCLECLYNYHLSSCRYSHKTGLLFLHNLVLYNHTKTPISLFSLILILINPIRMLYPKVSVFLLFLLLTSFQKKLLYDSLVPMPNSFFLLLQLLSLCFLTFFIAFPKSVLFINLQNAFSKIIFAFSLRSVFISKYGLN